MRAAHRKCASCGSIHDLSHAGPCEVCFGEKWITICSREGRCDAGSEGCARCDYRFQEHLYSDPAELAAALALTWPEAKRVVQEQPLHHWAANGLDNAELARKLKAIAKDDRLVCWDDSMRLTAFLQVLQPDGTLVWRGETITATWMERNEAGAVALLESSLPAWIETLWGKNWFSTLGIQWRRIRSLAVAHNAEFSTTTAVGWLLRPPAAVREGVSDLRKEYAGAARRSLESMVQASDLEFAEQVFLLSLDRGLLHSRHHLWNSETTALIADLTPLLANITAIPTTRKALERLAGKLKARWEAHLNHRLMLANANCTLPVDQQAQSLRDKCQAELDSRLAEHARLMEIRSRLQDLIESGRVVEAEGLAGMLTSQFNDLELNPVYRVFRYLRRLRAASAAMLIVLVMLVTVAALLKLRHAWRKPPSYIAVPLADGVTLTLLRVPAGTFSLGAGQSDTNAEPDEQPCTTVNITRAFWMAETEVTQKQYKAVTGTGPPAGYSPQSLTNASLLTGDDLPMVFVSWEESVMFCHKLQRLMIEHGMEGTVRLPTEAEWEYSCRAGSQAGFAIQAEFIQSLVNAAPSAGLRAARSPGTNAWGFFHMHGNASEWVLGAPVQYPGGTVTDWRVHENNKDRLHRGGSWNMSLARARSAARNWRPHGTAAEHIGFRVIWEPATGEKAHEQ